jgi:hypothetical protein
MKRNLYITVLLLAIVGSGYIFYSVTPRKFHVQDVSKSESFKLYQSGKPMNIDLTVNSNVDSSFTIRVVGLPSKGELFDSTFSYKQVDFKCIVDYYAGQGVEILYIPEGATKGDVKLSSRINAYF